MDIHDQTVLAKIWAWVSYLFSGGLFTSGMLDFLNENYGAVGAIGVLATFLLNWYYKHKELELKKVDVQE